LLSLSFSNNIGTLLQSQTEDLEINISKLKTDIKHILTKEKKVTNKINEIEPDLIESPEISDTQEIESLESHEMPLIPIDIKENIETNSPPYDPFINSNSPPYVPSETTETPPNIELETRTQSISPTPTLIPTSLPIQQTNSILQVEEPSKIIEENESEDKKVIINDLNATSSENPSSNQEIKKIIL
jgi:hypothetical protein